MSLARQYAAVGQNTTAAFEEETITHLKTNKSFQGKIQPISDLELLTELGLDLREAVSLHTRDRQAAEAINAQDILGALGEEFRVIKRMNNPASLHVDFICEKVVTGKDA